MVFKPNYRFDRAERARGKEAKRQEKREAQAARREAGRGADGSAGTDTDLHSVEPYEDHDGAERTIEE